MLFLKVRVEVLQVQKHMKYNSDLKYEKIGDDFPQ